MDLHQLPIEALESELKRRRSAQLAELRARVREHEQAIALLEKDLRGMGSPGTETRRRKVRT